MTKVYSEKHMAEAKTLAKAHGTTVEEAQRMINIARLAQLKERAELGSKHADGQRKNQREENQHMDKLVKRAQTREAGLRKMLALVGRATGGAVVSDNDAALRLMAQTGL